MWRVHIMLSLLIVVGLHGVASSQPIVQLARAGLQGALSACGEDAPDGLILHQVVAADGTLADAPLALLNPATNASRPVDVPDPSEWFSAQYGCSAFVRTATGAYYFVIGRTGEAFPLEFMDPADEWEYEEDAHWDTVGERRFALFSTPGYMGNKAIMMDLELGVYSDLTPLITDKGSMRGERFSPSGKHLTMDAGPTLDERAWLIPTDDPSRARQISLPMSSRVMGFDEAEKRLLFRNIDGDLQRLFIEEIATGETYLVSTDPSEKVEYDPYLSGWFLPGEDDLIAVLHHDRFALVDISGPEPVERFVIEGHRPYSRFIVAPSGLRGILTWKPAITFVDLETEESRVIATDDGTPLIGSLDIHGRWGMASLGPEGQPATGFGVVDVETGEYRTIHMLAESEQNDFWATMWSSDGTILLFTVIDANQQRHLSLINNELETNLPIAKATSFSVTLSPNGEWAAYSATSQTDAGPVHDMALVETETGTVTSVGSGLAPAWLGP
jgi:hypothetical protein